MGKEKVGTMKIVPKTGDTIGVLNAPHTIPPRAVVGTTATFEVGVKAVPPLGADITVFMPIRVYAQVRIAHTSGRPEYDGKSRATELALNQTVKLSVPISIPRGATTGDYNVFAEVFTEKKMGGAHI